MLCAKMRKLIEDCKCGRPNCKGSCPSNCQCQTCQQKRELSKIKARLNIVELRRLAYQRKISEENKRNERQKIDKILSLFDKDRTNKGWL